MRVVKIYSHYKIDLVYMSGHKTPHFNLYKKCTKSYISSLILLESKLRDLYHEKTKR